MIKLFYLLHVLATVVWVGGMFFAHQVLRPVAARLEPPVRLRLWAGVFGRFFPWVWAAVLLLLFTGQGIVAEMGGLGVVPKPVHLMAGIGYLMAAIFVFLYFVPYRRFNRSVEGEDWSAAAERLAVIRRLVGTNLTLGLLNIVLIFLLPALM